MSKENNQINLIEQGNEFNPGLNRTDDQTANQPARDDHAQMIDISEFQTSEPPVTKVDSIDLADLALSQDFESKAAVKKLITTVPLRKPNRHEFIRVHPDPAWRQEVPMLDLKIDGELYLVHRSIALGDERIIGEMKWKTLFTVINRQGDLTFWPVNMPVDGKTNEWNRSALVAAETAMRKWVQVKSNRTLGAYEPFFPVGDLPEPEWPEDVTFKQLFDLAFRDRFITDRNHPVLRGLRGEI